MAAAILRMLCACPEFFLGMDVTGYQLSPSQDAASGYSIHLIFLNFLSIVDVRTELSYDEKPGLISNHVDPI